MSLQVCIPTELSETFGLSESQANFELTYVDLVKYALLSAVIGYTIFIYVLKFYWDYFRLRKYNGPLAVPFLGNAYNPEAVQLIKWLSNLRKKYGKIVRIFVMDQPYLVLMDKEAAKVALTDTRQFIKGRMYQDKFGLIFGLGLVTSNNPLHKMDKAVLHRFFMEKSILNHVDFMSQMTNEFMIDKMEKQVGKSYNIEEFFHTLSLNIFMQFAFHKRYEAADIKWMSDITSDGSNVIGNHMILNLPTYKWIPRIKRVVGQVHRFLKLYVTPVYEARKQQIEEIVKANKNIDDEISAGNLVDDPLTAMIREGWDRQKIFDHVTTLAAAGHDTTAYCSCYALYLLAQNPDIQMKLKKEVKKVLGDRTNITSEDIVKLDYAKSVFAETLRIYSVIPHCTRHAIKDVEFKDENGKKHIIPSGTEVMVPFCVLNRDTDTWGEALRFDPHRFENTSIKGTTADAKRGYFPFAAGARQCIGASLALIEGTVMLSLLAQKYTFREDPNFKLKIVSGITLVSENGCSVLVEKDEEYATMNVEEN